jgi:hypothetical protein
MKHNTLLCFCPEDNSFPFKFGTKPRDRKLIDEGYELAKTNSTKLEMFFILI